MVIHRIVESDGIYEVVRRVSLCTLVSENTFVPLYLMSVLQEHGETINLITLSTILPNGLRQVVFGLQCSYSVISLSCLLNNLTLHCIFKGCAKMARPKRLFQCFLSHVLWFESALRAVCYDVYSTDDYDLYSTHRRRASVYLLHSSHMSCLQWFNVCNWRVKNDISFFVPLPKSTRHWKIWTLC